MLSSTGTKLTAVIRSSGSLTAERAAQDVSHLKLRWPQGANSLLGARTSHEPCSSPRLLPSFPFLADAIFSPPLGQTNPTPPLLLCTRKMPVANLAKVAKNLRAEFWVESEAPWEVVKVPLFLLMELQPRSSLALDAVCVYLFLLEKAANCPWTNWNIECFLNLFPQQCCLCCIGRYRCTDLLLSDYKVLSWQQCAACWEKKQRVKKEAESHRADKFSSAQVRSEGNPALTAW